MPPRRRHRLAKCLKHSNSWLCVALQDAGAYDYMTERLTDACDAGKIHAEGLRDLRKSKGCLVAEELKSLKKQDAGAGKSASVKIEKAET